MKRCSVCHEEKPTSEFHRRSNTKSGLQAHCKACRAAYRLANRDRYNAAGKRHYREVYAPKMRERWLRDQYGIGQVDYDRMFADQQGRCAICLGPPDRMNLFVDHDHETGKVRGLLCDRCNRGIAHFRSPESLDNAAEYLRRAALGDAVTVPVLTWIGARLMGSEWRLPEVAE